MGKLAQNVATNTTAPGRRPLDLHLFSGSKGAEDDVRFQSGFPCQACIERIY
jgi:hypothetical protein